MAKRIEKPKLSLKPLQAAAQDTVDENREAIGEKLSNTLQTLIKSSWNAQENKALKLQILKIQRDLRTDTKETKLSAKILKEYNDIAIKVKTLQENAATNRVGAALKDSGGEVVSRKHLQSVLRRAASRGPSFF